MYIFLIMLSFLASFILEVIPLPHLFNILRPNWILMVVISWGLSTRVQFSIIQAWLIGLLVDLLLGSLIGLHGFIYVICVFAIKKFHYFLKDLNLLQLTIPLSLCFIFHTLFITLVYGMLGFPHPYQNFLLLPTIISILIWPLVFVAINHCSKFFLPIIRQ